MPDNNPIPAAPNFLQKWQAGFADNEFLHIREATFRDFATDIDGQFVHVDTLTTNMVRGALFRVPYLSVVGGVLTVNIAQVPARYRIVGLEIMALNGVTATEAAAGTRADPVTFQLVAYPTGTIDALVDEKPTTTATVKARLVRTSGTAAQKQAGFELLVPEDHPYLKGEVVKYVFPTGETRLLEWRANSVGSPHPVPTGADDDPVYAPYSPLALSAVTRAEFETVLDSLESLAADRDTTTERLNELTASQFIDFRTENVVSAPFFTPGDGSSNVLKSACTMYLPLSSSVRGVLFALRVPADAPGQVVVTLDATGTLDGKGAGTSLVLAPGTVRVIRKAPSVNLTSKYQTVFSTSGTITRTDTLLQFDQEAEYPELANGTYTVSLDGRQVGVTVRARLGINCTEPSIPTSGFELLDGAFVAGRRHLYLFCVGPTVIEYYIRQLP